MRSILVVFLALLPPMLAAAWTWFQLQKAERDLDALANFEGMHFED
jgi:hypothetical protein